MGLKSIFCGLMIFVSSMNLFASHRTPKSGLRPFTSDGCSASPDKSILLAKNFIHCCMVHDIDYWVGGLIEGKEGSDLQLYACMKETTKSPPLAASYFIGVSAGGQAEIDGIGSQLPWRWSYGWPGMGRYENLNSAQLHEALVEIENLQRDVEILQKNYTDGKNWSEEAQQIIDLRFKNLKITQDQYAYFMKAVIEKKEILYEQYLKAEKLSTPKLEN